MEGQRCHYTPQQQLRMGMVDTLNRPWAGWTRACVPRQRTSLQGLPFQGERICLPVGGHQGPVIYHESAPRRPQRHERRLIRGVGVYGMVQRLRGACRVGSGRGWLRHKGMGDAYRGQVQRLRGHAAGWAGRSAS